MYQRFNKNANLMVSHIVFKWRPKFCIVVLEDYGNNLVQVKDNNVNGVDEMASILWDIMTSHKASMFNKWLMRHELINMKRSHIGGLLCVNKKSLIVDWLWSSIEELVKNAWVRKCQAKVKWQRRQCIMDIRWSLHCFACMDKDLENHYALIWSSSK